MVAGTHPERGLDHRTLVPALGLLSLTTVLDLVLGRSLFNVVAPALLADVAVLAALVLFHHRPPVALILGVAASVGISLLVELTRRPRVLGAPGPPLHTQLLQLSTTYSPIMGAGSGWPGFAELGGLGLLTATSLRTSRPAVGAGSAALLAGALAAMVGWRQHGTFSIPVGSALFLVFAAAVGSGLYLRSIDRGRAVAARLVRQDERNAIARELHDLVAHHVTGIVLQAQAATLVADTRPELAQEALVAIEQAGSDALRSMRAMVGTLRADGADAPIAPTATLDDLRHLADPTRPGQVPVQVHLSGPVDALPASTLASLHRIALEGVTNARRHAIGARAIDVTVRGAADAVTIAVVDDGAAPAPRAGQGYGLVGIAERVAALGGRSSAGPGPHGGWVVEATIPASAAGAAS